MTSKRQIQSRLNSAFDTKANRTRYQSAIIGHPDGTVYIADRPGYVWARVGGQSGQIIQLYARGLVCGFNMPVVINRLAHRPQDYGIVDLDLEAWPATGGGETPGGWDGSNPIGKHGTQHWYYSGDPTLVHLRAFTPLRVYRAGGMIIGVMPGIIPRAGVDLNILQQEISLVDEIPSTAGQQRYSLISLDSNGILSVTRGTAVSGLLALSLVNVPKTPAGHFRLAAVRCYNGQTAITETATNTDILDLRWPQETIAGSPYALFGTQSANLVLAGPASGAAALSAFRALVFADLPDGHQAAVAIKSADYVLTTTDEVVVFTATATATLPAATGTGQTYRIVCRAGTLTIDGNGTDTIKGELTQTLNAGDDLIVTDTAATLWE